MFCGRIRVLGAALRDLGVCCSGQPAVPLSARKINCAKSAKPPKSPKNGLRIWLSPVLAHLNLNVLRADKGTGGCPERPRVCVVQGSAQYPYPPKINCAKSAKSPKNGLRIWLSPVLAHL